MATRKKKNRPSPAESSDSGSAELLKRKMLGRYEMQRKLGAGGMGAVYLALDTELNRLVALKILPPEKASNPTLVKRFKAEAQAVAQLTHDNIVRVYESGEIDGYLYIALEYVKGTDVHRLVKKRGRLPVRRATEIVTQVAMALDHAFQEGIVHRDIKPANLLITESGVVKLTDLGLARVLDENEETNITRAGTTVGTVDYMAPEQARSSKAADVRSDIYSLGCTWYHMLTGSPPFPDGSITNKLQAHAVSRVPDPRSLNESVPESVVGVIQRMMSKKPEDRHQSPRELLDDLKAVRSSKKEISADDLAALAGEVEEISPRRSSRQSGVDEDGVITPPRSSRTEQDQPGKSNRRKSKGSSVNGSSEVIPPREKRRLSDEDPEEKKQLNLEPFVYGGIVLGVVLMIGGLYYVISGVSNAVDRGDERQVNLLEESEELQEERAAEAEAAQNGQHGSSENATTQIKPDSQAMPVSNAAGDMPNTLSAEQQLARADSWPTVRVIDGSVNTDGKSAHTISAAIAKTEAKKFVVELKTSTPVQWDEPVILDGRTMILRAAKESAGAIVVKSAGVMSNALLSVRKGGLLLDGIHFGLLGYDLPGEKELTLLRLVDSDLQVRNSTFTQEETRAAPIALCNFSQGNERLLECSWENCLIRGPQWRPFVCNASRMKFQATGCLVLSGSSPVLTLSAPRQTRNGNDSTVQRHIAFADSYVVCSGTALIVENATGGSAVPATQFRFKRSSFVASAGIGDKPFAEVRQWPENVLASAGKAKLSLLDWISEDSQFAGWKNRLTATTSRTRKAFKVASQADWQKFWGNPGLTSEWTDRTANQLQPEQIAQARPNSLVDLSLTAAARPRETTQNRLQEIRLPALSAATYRSDFARTHQPAFKPVSVATGKDIPVLKVDATRTDLGDFVASRKLPGEVILEVSGFGLRACSPVQIDGSKVLIRFTSTGKGPPLTFRPGTERGGKESQPWIQVKNGSLQLEGGVFRVDPPSRAPMPSSWVQGQNADIRLQNCYVTGPESADKNLVALVDMQGAANGSPHRLQVANCFFDYGGTLVQADLANCQVQATGAVLVSQGHLFSLAHAGQGTAEAGQIHLERCTLSSRKGALHFNVATPAAHGKPQVQAFVRECAFVPAVSSSSGEIAHPQIVSSQIAVDQLPQQVWWWGTRNGFAPELQRSFGKETDLAKVWPGFWGAGHVKEALLADDGVLLAKGTLDRKNLRPSSFQLYEQSQASHWAEDQTAIGADAASLDLKDYEQERTPQRPNGNEKPKSPTQPRF